MRPRKAISRKWALACLCLLSFALVLLPPEWARWPGNLLRPVLMPLAQPGSSLAHRLRGQIDEVFAEKGPDPRVAAMTSQVLYMQQLLQQQRRSIENLSKYRSLLEGFSCKLIEARVVADEPLPLRNRGLVNAGSAGGARPQDLVTTRHMMHDYPKSLPAELQLAVLGQSFVVGRLISCAPYSATLQLVTDRNFRMPVRVYRLIQPGQQRTVLQSGPSGAPQRRQLRNDGQTPVVVGQPLEMQAQGDGRLLLLPHVPEEYLLQEGDLVKTAATDFLPVDLALGVVSEVEPEKDAIHFCRAKVRPLADLDALRDVIIVLPGRD